MSSRNIKKYISKFLNGESSSEDELKLRKLLSEKDANDDNQRFQSYIKLTQIDEPIDFSPIEKDGFFLSMELKNKGIRKKYYWVAAVLICGIIAFGEYWINDSEKQPKTIAQTEIDQSFETTKLALNLFSTHINKGLKSIENGMDISRPYRSLSKLQSQERLKTEK